MKVGPTIENDTFSRPEYLALDMLYQIRSSKYYARFSLACIMPGFHKQVSCQLFT